LQQTILLSDVLEATANVDLELVVNGVNYHLFCFGGISFTITLILSSLGNLLAGEGWMLKYSRQKTDRQPGMKMHNTPRVFSKAAHLGQNKGWPTVEC
uniref:Uncharacterized protein n=1 Tax=Varanus komodoensis TaxID=61221 RepID=A0A8D2J9J5_VARKO